MTLLSEDSNLIPRTNMTAYNHLYFQSQGILYLLLPFGQTSRGAEYSGRNEGKISIHIFKSLIWKAVLLGVLEVYSGALSRTHGSLRRYLLCSLSLVSVPLPAVCVSKLLSLQAILWTISSSVLPIGQVWTHWKIQSSFRRKGRMVRSMSKYGRNGLFACFLGHD